MRFFTKQCRNVVMQQGNGSKRVRYCAVVAGLRTALFSKAGWVGAGDWPFSHFAGWSPTASVSMLPWTSVRNAGNGESLWTFGIRCHRGVFREASFRLEVLSVHWRGPSIGKARFGTIAA